MRKGLQQARESSHILCHRKQACQMFSLIFVAVLVAFGLGACATLPKPTTSAPISVTINFAGVFSDLADESTTTKSALTYWRKRNDDGSLGDRFAIGGANAFNRAINTTRFRKVRDEVVTLDSGEYFLDSFELESSKSIAISQDGDYTKRDGWDHTTNTPKYLLLSLRKPITLPKFIIEVLEHREQGSKRVRLLVCLADGEKIPEALRFGTYMQPQRAPKAMCEEVFGKGFDTRQVPSSVESSGANSAEK